jgi:hypothetical protein
MSKKSQVLSTESLNSYGTWLPVAGAMLEKFKANPVMFYNHKTYSMLPIGRWDNIRVENGQIVADPVFDTDEESQKIKAKWESGSVRGASIAADVIETSSDPKWLKPGQIRETITRYEIYEASLTPLPANAECLTLSLRKNGIELTDGAVNSALHLLKPDIDMKNIALKLGLAQDATEAQIVEKITALQSSAARGEKLEAHFSKQAEGLDEKQKGIFATLSKTDVDKAMEFLELSKGESREEKPAEKPLKVSDLVKNKKSSDGKDTEQQDEKETFEYMQKHDSKKLEDIRRTDPVKFQKLVDDYYAGKNKRSE